jgi:uncharacterized membrane protein YkoI
LVFAFVAPTFSLFAFCARSRLQYPFAFILRLSPLWQRILKGTVMTAENSFLPASGEFPMFDGNLVESLHSPLLQDFVPCNSRKGETPMNIQRKIGILMIAGLAAAGMAAAQEQEKKIKRSDLPLAVEKTVAAESAGATIKGFSKEKENGQTFYEAEMTVNGHTKDMLIDANGTVVEVEEEVALDALSPEVKAGLSAKAGKGKITTVETIKKRDKLVAYEAKVNTNGKKSEVQVGPDGKPLDHEE